MDRDLLLAAWSVAARMEQMLADGRVRFVDALHVALEEQLYPDEGVVHLVRLPTYSRLLEPGEPCPTICPRCLETCAQRQVAKPSASLVEAATRHGGYTVEGECQGCMMVFVRVKDGKAVVQYG